MRGFTVYAKDGDRHGETMGTVKPSRQMELLCSYCGGCVFGVKIRA